MSVTSAARGAYTVHHIAGMNHFRRQWMNTNEMVLLLVEEESVIMVT